MIDSVNINLSVFYKHILPWNLNIKDVMVLHKTNLYLIDTTFKYYLYKQVKLIEFFGNYFKIDVTHSILNDLEDSFQWYIAGENIVYPYLRLSGVYIPYLITDKIILEIKNKNIIHLYTKFQQLIPDCTIDSLTKWFTKKFYPFNDKKDISRTCVIRLTEDIYNNCTSGIEYMNSFFEFVSMSMVLKEKIEMFNKKYKNEVCNQVRNLIINYFNNYIAINNNLKYLY